MCKSSLTGPARSRPNGFCLATCTQHCLKGCKTGLSIKGYIHAWGSYSYGHYCWYIDTQINKIRDNQDLPGYVLEKAPGNLNVYVLVLYHLSHAGAIKFYIYVIKSATETWLQGIRNYMSWIWGIERSNDCGISRVSHSREDRQAVSESPGADLRWGSLCRMTASNIKYW